MNQKRLPIFQVSAFANHPFSGNPAAVCPLVEWLPDETMQSIAAENNLSETAFFVGRRDGAYDLRWFTPKVEVDLCGHATLASGYVVLNHLESDKEIARFHTHSGELIVSRKQDLYSLDLPTKTPNEVFDEQVWQSVTEATGKRPIQILDAGLPVAVLEHETDVANLEPDLNRLVETGLNWLSVTAPGTEPETDFVSRYFAPASGIDEDPVTGSAHGWLVPYWASRLGKNLLVARQVSERGGWLWCEYSGERVSVAGRVRDYLRGEVVIS